MLPVLADLVGVVDVQPEQVFQPFVAVHAAAVLTDLHQPTPDDVGWGLDGDGVRRGGDRTGDDVIAGMGGLDLRPGRAPVPQPRPGNPGHQHSDADRRQRFHAMIPPIWCRLHDQRDLRVGRSRFCNVAEDRDQDPDRDQRHRGEARYRPDDLACGKRPPAKS